MTSSTTAPSGRITPAEPPQADAPLESEGLDPAAVAPAVDGRFMSAFVRARKPVSAEAGTA